MDEDEVGQRLLSIPCVGTLTASTISTRDWRDGSSTPAAVTLRRQQGWYPRQYSTGGWTTLLGISKRGNKKIRTLLVQCARVFIQKLEHQSGKLADWVRELLCRKKATLSSPVLGKQAGQNSLGTDGATAKLTKHKGRNTPV
ncbi:transposase [Klebsiella pneumoniae]